MKALSALLALCIYSGSVVAESVDLYTAVRLMADVQALCKQYAFHGEMFWMGHIRQATEAPGLVTLNEVIRVSVVGARSADHAREIAWQKCLDYVFNNQNSKDYIR